MEHPSKKVKTQHANLEWIQGDFGNQNDITQALHDIDIVYHLASTTQPKTSNLDPIFDIQSNLIKTISLLDLIRNYPNVKIIFLSSGGTIYGEPQLTQISESNPTEPKCSYGIVKLMIEKYLALYNFLYGVDYRILRLANPYGPGQENLLQGVIGAFLMRVLEDQKIEIWGDGSVVRDFIYIDDTIDALILLSNYQGSDRIFNIGSGCGRNILEIISSIENITGKKAKIIFCEKRNFDVPYSVLDISLAYKELKWAPKTSFEIGLISTMKWLKR